MQMLAGLGPALAPDGLPAEFPRIKLTPQCFQLRRLFRYGEDWYVSPNEEPPPSGEGKGSVDKSLGLKGFAAPRVLWQSDLKTSTGKPRKAKVLAPEKTIRKGEPIPWAEQQRAAQEREFDKGKIKMAVPPVVAGRGDARRAYKRPVLRIDGRRVPDKGKVVEQLEAGPVWWRSSRKTKDGRKPEPLVLEPLTADQLSAIEFQLWLEKTYPNPVDRLRYLVDTWKALVIVNHSGGKDSQAMYLHLTRDLGIPHDQIRVVHADLPGADWPGTLDHVERYTDHDVKVVRAQFKDGAVKELYDYVMKRGKFPSAQQRYCTSELKTSPINAWIRQALCELNGMKKPCDLDKPGKRRVVISAMGMRAEESDNRAGLSEWELNVGESTAGRAWFEYLPIHRWKTPQVFRTIKRYGQEPFWIYGRTPAARRRLIEAGSVDARGNAVPMQRMSCVFCIMGSLRDIGVASRIGPQSIAEEICKIEDETGFTFKKGISFPQLITSGEAQVEKGRAALRAQAGRRGKRHLKVLSSALDRQGPCR
jgi:3'-phosphoadenosine 5'-phosphosulfate sulfotransferase (PAPS reductase)/FAD synthetase